MKIKKKKARLGLSMHGSAGRSMLSEWSSRAGWEGAHGQSLMLKLAAGCQAVDWYFPKMAKVGQG